MKSSHIVFLDVVQYLSNVRCWYIHIVQHIKEFDFILSHVLLWKGDSLLIQSGMVSMVQATIGDEVPMVVTIKN